MAVLTANMPLVTLPFTGNERVLMDSNLANGVNPSTEAASMSQLANYLSGLPAWVPGRFYGIPLGATIAAAITVASTTYAYPIYIPSAITLKSLNLSVTTGQTGGAARIGIYADNGAGYPGALISGTDTGSLAATGTAVVGPTGLTIVLNPGVYWVASTFSASSTMPSVISQSAVYTSDVSNQMGYDTAAHALAGTAQAVTGIILSATFAALPATFTAGATLNLNATTPVVSLGV